MFLAPLQLISYFLLLIVMVGNLVFSFPCIFLLRWSPCNIKFTISAILRVVIQCFCYKYIHDVVKISVQIPAFTSFRYTPWCGISGYYDNSMLNFLRKCPIVFHSSCIILHSYQQCTRVPMSPLLCQHLLFSIFYNSHPNGCEVVATLFL